MQASQEFKVNFFFDRPLSLTHRRELKSFILDLFRRKRVGLKYLNIIFCSDKKLLEINREYLNHDYFTDIISFDFGSGNGVEGEIYISAERVRENARQLKVPLKIELHRVVFHGVLHLCGYKDRSPGDKNRMTSMENRLIADYFEINR